MTRQNYNNYYDPAGSHSNQPSGYTYQQHPSTANYGTTNPANYNQNYNGSYGNQQQYEASNDNANRSAAATLSNLSNQQNYAHSSADTRTSNTTSDGTSSWTPANYPSASQQPRRTQANSTPAYAQAPGSTRGRLNLPSGQAHPSQSSSTTFPSHSQPETWHSQTQEQPRRYASPHHAVQAQQQQQMQQRNATSSVYPSPYMGAQRTHQRQPSGSVEPSPVTVDPSQVYDIRAEQQRKAQIELEKKQKREAEQAKVKAAEDAKKAKEQQKADEEGRREKDKARRIEESRAADAARAGKERKAAERKKKREENKKSQSAAAALATMAASTPTAPVAEESPHDEEAEMRAMFQKMREFNAKNPAMLAKLWEEERKAHSTPTVSSSKAVAASPSAPVSAKTKTPSKDKSAAASRATQAASADEPAPAAPVSTLASNSQSASAQQAQEAFTSPAKATPQPSKAPSSNQPPPLWPPHKMVSLAEITVSWLLKQNPGATITKENVIAILNGNPNYVKLCEALEGYNLKFERSLLARELLKAVPDSSKDRSLRNGAQAAAGSASTENPPRANSGQKRKQTSSAVVYEAPTFQPLPPPSGSSIFPHPTPGTFNVPSSAMYISAGGPVQSSSQAPEVKPEVKFEKPPRPPANKEEAARKRTFGDLVDLTAEDSDEGPPAKTLKMPGGHSFPVPHFPHFPPGHPAAQVPFPGTPPQMYKPLGPPPPQMMPQIMGAPRMGMMANGPGIRHPLPHMPSAAPVMSKAKGNGGPSLEYLQNERIKGKVLVEPIMRDRVARKSHYNPHTIARDVLLATGRHPDMRPLNAHLLGMEKLLGSHGGSYDTDGSRNNRSDLATVRWDIIDPGPSKAAAAPPLTLVPNCASAAASVAVPDDIDIADADDEMDVDIPAQAVDNGDGTMAMTALVPAPIKKRGRGRPRKSAPSALINSAAGPGPSSQASTLLKSSSNDAASGVASSTGKVGYAAFRKYDENGNPIKMKGRPKGWRKNVHSREALGLTPMKWNTPSRATNPESSNAKDSKDEEPEWQIYPCKWYDCDAELHNHEVFTKHVSKVHGKPNDNKSFECLWEGHHEDGESTVSAFAAREDWMKHMEEQHLTPVKWKLGDGPRDGTSRRVETDSEAYLSDAYGRSVTPVIDGDRASLTPRATQSAQEAARRVVERLKERKRTVGYTTSKGGSTLVNKKRRGGFQDDEDFEDYGPASPPRGGNGGDE